MSALSLIKACYEEHKKLLKKAQRKFVKDDNHEDMEMVACEKHTVAVLKKLLEAAESND